MEIMLLPGYYRRVSCKTVDVKFRFHVTYVEFRVNDVNQATHHDDEVEHVPWITKVVLQRDGEVMTEQTRLF